MNDMPQAEAQLEVSARQHGLFTTTCWMTVLTAQQNHASPGPPWNNCAVNIDFPSIYQIQTTCQLGSFLRFIPILEHQLPAL